MRAFILLAALVPAAAGACPVRNDLSDGVRFTYADGTVEIVSRPTGASDVTLEVIEAGRVVQRDRLIHGAYLGRSAAVSDMGEEYDIMTIDYARKLPAPAPGLSFRVNAVETWDSRTDLVEQHAWSDTLQVRIGACSYKAFDGTLRRFIDGALDAVEVTRFMPALGAGYVRAVADTEQDLDPIDLVRVEAIR